jgi:hypothetical protein
MLKGKGLNATSKSRGFSYVQKRLYTLNKINIGRTKIKDVHLESMRNPLVTIPKQNFTKGRY